MVDVAKYFEPLSTLRQRRTAPLVLELDLTEGVVAETPGDPLGQILAMRRPRLAALVEAIHRGAADQRVTGLIAKVGGRPIGFAKIQELREAVDFFRASGKPTLAWAESFGEFGPGTLPYYLACSFDKIAVQPSGTVGLTGLSVISTFVKDALDKVGITYEAGARHEYKSALNTVLERGYTEPEREATARIVASLSEQVVAGVCRGRGMEEERVQELIDSGPHLAAEAVESGLVDRTAYRDQIYREFRRECTGTEPDARHPHLQFVTRYHRPSPFAGRIGSVQPRPYVALISGHGPIMAGRSKRSPLGSVMGAETVAAAFRAARRDPHVRAVVFRVDSPGGSYVASDTIWREVVLTEESGTPVVVSMGDMAGSGGYFVSLGAQHIVAQPGTLTGSIGVYIAKPVMSELLGKVGVNTESVEGGEHALMFATDRRFSDSEWERINALLDHVYDDFTAKVARSRGMSRERVHELARGRVWTGQDAHERGLVDTLGGLDTALAAARQRAGLSTSAPLLHFPKLSPLERLIPPESSEDRAAAVSTSGVRAEAWGSLAPIAAKLGLPAAGPLAMPGAWEIR